MGPVDQEEFVPVRPKSAQFLDRSGAIFGVEVDADAAAEFGGLADAVTSWLKVSAVIFKFVCRASAPLAVVPESAGGRRP